MISGRACFALCIAIAGALVAARGEASASSRPKAWVPPFTSDKTEIAPDGTAYITRIVPIPLTISDSKCEGFAG